MKTLEELVEEYNSKTQAVRNILESHKGKAMLWIKSEKSFYILSASAKGKGYQLTYFIDNKPISDKVRESFLDKDFIEELALNEAYLSRII